MREGSSFGLLRRAALIATSAGAVGAVGFMLRAGRHNNSRILLVLFTIWVLSPFAALFLASAVSKGWRALTRATLYSVMLVLALGSLAIYGYDALRPSTKAATVFVIVPLVSWLLIAMVVPLAALLSGRLSRPGDGA